MININKKFAAFAMVAIGVMLCFPASSKAWGPIHTPPQMGNYTQNNSGLCTIDSFYPSSTQVQSGSNTQIFWWTSNCNNVSISGGIFSGPQASWGSASTGPLLTTTTYTITATGWNGAVTKNTTVNVSSNSNSQLPCSIDTFYASSTQIHYGDSAQLFWWTSNCSNVSISGGTFSGPQSSWGSASTGSLVTTTAYTMTATGANGTVVKVVTVNVASSSPCIIPFNSFYASPSSINAGESSKLYWSTSNCTQVYISGGTFSGPQAFYGNIDTGALNTNTTFTLTAIGASGPAVTASVTVSVSTPLCTVNVFKGNPQGVLSGYNSTLVWDTSNCTSVSVSGGNISSTQPSGSQDTGPLTASVTYTLVAAGSSTITKTTVVSVVTNQTNQQNQSGCYITNFNSSPNTVSYGNSSTLIWATTGCSGVVITGPNISGSQALSGSLSTGPVYTSNTYTITASLGSYSVSQVASVGAYQQQSQYYNPPAYYSNYYSQPYYYNYSNASYPPSVTTYAANAVSGTAAMLNGYVSTQYNSYNNSTYYFQYGISSNLDSQTVPKNFNSSSGNVSSYISSLTPNTTYYFRLVGFNSYGTNYGTILSFVTASSASTVSVSPITTVVTELTPTSARLNGLLPTSSSGSTSAYFEYGTTSALGSQTSPQTVSTNTVMNYYDTIPAEADTTYYYRATAVYGGTTYHGDIVSFSTPNKTASSVASYSSSSSTFSSTKVGVGAGTPLVQLAISDTPEKVASGDTVTYTINYKNISNTDLSNVVLNVILPVGVSFKSSTIGFYTTDNTVADNIGLLAKDAEGEVTVVAIADKVAGGNSLIATATLAFTTPSLAQGSAVAYALNTFSGTSGGVVLAGNAFLTGAFFPHTLLGWVLLLGLIWIFIAVARYMYHWSARPSAHALPHDDHGHGGH